MFVPNDIVCDIERVIKSFPSRMLSWGTPFNHLCTLLPYTKRSTEESRYNLDLIHFNKQRRACIYICMCIVYGRGKYLDNEAIQQEKDMKGSFYMKLITYQMQGIK